MEFLTTLIVTAKKQSPEAAKFLKDNCTYVDNHCWIFEGAKWCLEHYEVMCNEIADGAVPSLGGLSKPELVEICQDAFGVNVYDQAYKPDTD